MNPRPPSLAGFDCQPQTRLVFGNHALDRVGEFARQLGARRALLVTDKGIAAAGHPARAAAALEREGIAVMLFEEVRENPTTLDVDRCVEVAREAQIDFLIGLGGGSSLDTAKGCNFLLTNGGRMQDYWGVGKATRPMLPLIAVPTTAGTGSECQSFALISDEATHQKMACGDVKAAAKVAILDPLLTVSQPARVTACTGIDALAHALETAVTKKRTPHSAMYSREAFALCMAGMERVMADPQDIDARAMMQLGAAYAGTAIENSMLGAAHSAANPLTARFGIVHGQAVGMVLPAVIAFNARLPEAHAQYLALASVAGLASVEELLERLRQILNAAGMLPVAGVYPVPAGAPVDDAVRSALAQEAARQWTAGFNPRPMTAEDFEGIYREVLG